MIIKNIIFLVETPILNRYYNRYGIKELQDEGFSVTIWDLSPFLLPFAFNNIINDLCDYDKCGFLRLYSIQEFYLAAHKQNCENTLFICSMGYLWEYRKIFQTLRRENLHFCYFMQELAPDDAIYKRKSLKEKLSYTNILKALTRRIPRFFHRIKNADFILGCGCDEIAISNYKSSRLCSSNCTIYYFHSSNYEDCLMNLDKSRLLEKRYCVFIDQFLPYHPDLIADGFHLNAANYYKKMNYFFDIVEKLYNLEVVIAAHPRANYDLYLNAFGKRKILKNQTCRLIKDSEFVLCHFSNSLGYVAVFNKPVIVVTTNDINCKFHDSIDIICSLLGTTETNIDNLNKNDNLKELLDKKLIVNKSIYDEYIKKYMKKNYTGVIDGEPLWVQIGRFLSNIGGKDEAIK